MLKTFAALILVSAVVGATFGGCWATKTGNSPSPSAPTSRGEDLLRMSALVQRAFPPNFIWVRADWPVAFDHYFTWQVYGEGGDLMPGKPAWDKERAVYILDGNKVGIGSAGFQALCGELKTFAPGTRVLMFPDYDQDIPGLPEGYPLPFPFDYSKLYNVVVGRGLTLCASSARGISDQRKDSKSRPPATTSGGELPSSDQRSPVPQERSGEYLPTWDSVVTRASGMSGKILKWDSDADFLFRYLVAREDPDPKRGKEIVYDIYPEPDGYFWLWWLRIGIRSKSRGYITQLSCMFYVPPAGPQRIYLVLWSDMYLTNFRFPAGEAAFVIERERVRYRGLSEEEQGLVCPPLWEENRARAKALEEHRLSTSESDVKGPVTLGHSTSKPAPGE